MIIYKITNNTNGKSYIGQTIKTLQNRWSNHIYMSSKMCKSILGRAIRKYGSDNFTVEIICTCLSKEMMNVMETFYIMVHKTYVSEGGYNLTWGGEGSNGYHHTNETKEKMKGKIVSDETKKRMKLKKLGIKQSIDMIHRRVLGRLGYRHSEETKQRIGISNKGKSSWMKGKHISEETKQKISVSNIGHRHTEETKQKMSEKKLGRHLSDEHKRKIGEKSKGRKHTEEAKRKISENHHTKKKHS